MQIFLNIFITFALMFWPFMFAMSPMMLDAPGSDNNKANLTAILLILSYPVSISLLLWLFGGNYFGVEGFTLFKISAVVIAIAFFFFGYFRMFINLARGIANSGYSIAGKKTYYDGNRIDGVDSESFTVLEAAGYLNFSRHAKDENYLYFDGVIVEGVIPDSFHKADINGDIYWLSSTQVIHDDKVLPRANPNNFLGFDGFDGWTYSISNNEYFVYSYGNPLPDVDRNTFTPLNDFYAKDKNQIFEKDEIILPDAEAESFELFDEHSFGKDRNHIYYMAHVQPFAIKDIDLESFEILDGDYLRDKNHIYYVHQYGRIKKLEKIDAVSFEVTNYDESTSSDARDKNHYYQGGAIVGDRE